MSFPMLDFVLASILMGIGIGADVAAATFAQARMLKNVKVAILWVAGVSITHTVFPMLGYLLTYFSIQLQPSLTPIVGMIAFACILVYLAGEFRALCEPDESAENTQILVTLGLILAVSWDALWSGPAKSAQVIGWPELLVWASFIIVGGLVSMLALLSLRWGTKINNKDKPNTYVFWLGTGIQYSVIAYFGLLALLRYTLNIHFAWWQTMLLASTLIVIAMLLVSQSRINNDKGMTLGE